MSIGRIQKNERKNIQKYEKYLTICKNENEKWCTTLQKENPGLLYVVTNNHGLTTKDATSNKSLKTLFPVTH